MKTSPVSYPLSKSASGLIEKEVAGELLLCDPKSKKAFSLNRAAAFVWKYADGKTSIEELARMLAEETGTPADTRVVEFALRALDKDGLMEYVDLYTAGEDANLGRRQLFSKLGWAAALIVAVPLVLTVTARKANASCPPGGCT
jgi:ferric-dicitrate binding protein FerR (iron transport regulator)